MPSEVVPAEEEKKADLLSLINAAKTQGGSSGGKKRKRRRKLAPITNYADILIEIYEEDPQITAFVEQLNQYEQAPEELASEITNFIYPPDKNSTNEVLPEIEEDEEEIKESDEREIEDFVNEKSGGPDPAFDLLKYASTKCTQAVRYAREGAPMWYSDRNRPKIA